MTPFSQPPEDPRAPGLQRTAPRFGLPAGLHESIGQPPTEHRVSDSDDQGALRGEPFQPGRCVVDAGDLSRGWVLPAQSPDQGSPADCDRPRSEWETKPAESRAFEVELAQQRRGGDLASGRQHVRRGDGTGSVAGEHEVGTGHELLELCRNALVFVDAGGLIGLTPRPEATGVDPASVDVRRAGMPYEGNARLRLNRAFHSGVVCGLSLARGTG